ncbi:IS66 family insertion sequence element accessory protein TnpA [Xiashengella succiniciproducens]|jgi:transposase-like protein|uniref:Transposase n=1 Tax=Xiashengella succiniciproducens TaxID=2949635 RepID=A0A9J6ZMR1_9BACT|nr:transposase [Alkaliflexus sp. Ai-910]URW78799.1 transposase [Alkaliflexus sp. Ai-910]
MRMTLTTFKQLYKEYQESNLSVRDFCSNQALSPSSFYYWRKQLWNTAQEEPKCFIPLVFDSVSAEHPVRDNQSRVTSSRTDDINSSTAPVELVFPNGTKMVIRENMDLELLRAIVHLYD